MSAAGTKAALGTRRDPRQHRTLFQLLLALGVFALLFVLFAQQELWGGGAALAVSGKPGRAF